MDINILKFIAMQSFIIYFAFVIFKVCSASNVISIYGDVYKDKEFFAKTFPWIIDNIGGELSVEYHLLGSGRYSVPQMCALEQLHSNTFLQSQYLQCEAEGKPSEGCLCSSGINPEYFRDCVLSKGYLAKEAALKYSKLRIDASPVVEMGPKNTVFEVAPNWYLKKICTIFGDDLPRGCVKPFACNGTSESFGKQGVSHFNCEKSRCCNLDYFDGVTIPTTTVTTPAYTSPKYYTTSNYELSSTSSETDYYTVP